MDGLRAAPLHLETLCGLLLQPVEQQDAAEIQRRFVRRVWQLRQ